MEHYMKANNLFLNHQLYHLLHNILLQIYVYNMNRCIIYIKSNTKENEKCQQTIPIKAIIAVLSRVCPHRQ